MELPRICLKRLNKDMKDMIKDPIENVYLHWDESNILKCYLIIIGPTDTPYENGFYLFEFNFSKDFPYKPPRVKYLTTDGKTRMNPNLYENGKICLSILNTWDGPQWTSCQSIRSIALSFQMILNKYPIQNEPGYGLEKGNKSKLYNHFISHANIRVSVLQMIKNTPKGFEFLKKNMIDYFLKNYNWYEKYCKKRINKYRNKKLRCPLYINWTESFNYNKLLKNIQKLKLTLQPNIPQLPSSLNDNIRINTKKIKINET